MPLLPTTEGVAVAWLRTLPEIPAGVATTLPATREGQVPTWAEHGFITISVVGGTVRDTNLRMPVVSVDAWAVAPNSDRPPWGKANGLTELVRDACYREDRFPVQVVPSPGDYLPALVQSASLVTSESRRVPDPDTSRAHYVLDVALYWTVVR